MGEWLAFAGALFLFLIVVILPGYVLSRCIGATRYLSIVAAAPISCAIYSIFGVVLFRLGLLGHMPLLACTVGLMVLAIACALILNAVKKRPIREAFIPRRFTPQRLDWRFAVLYAAVGMIVVALTFLCHIGSPDNVNQMSDNVVHLTTIADMASVGNYSMIDSSSYVGVVPDNQVINPSRSYYPEGFHILASLVMALTGLPIGIVENAVVYGFVAVLYPLGFSLFMQLAFPTNRAAVAFGAFLTCACVMYPVRCLVVNGFFPFAVGMALVPAALSFAMLSCADHLSRGIRLRWFLAALLIFIGVACVHPSAFLAALAMLVPFMVLKLTPFLARRPGSTASLSRKRRIVWSVGALVIIGAVWLILYKMPFLAALVGFEWDYHLSLPNALFYVLSMALRLEIPAVLLAILVFIGFLRAVCSRQTAWLSASFAFVAFLYIATVAGSGTVKHVAGGFWYTDPERLSAMVAIMAVPLCACAFAFIYAAAKRLLNSMIPTKEIVSSRAISAATALCLLGGFCIINFAPDHDTYGGRVNTPFGVTAYQASMCFNGEEFLIYTPEEKAFVEKVKTIVPEDSAVLNFPADGSILADPLNDLRVYYRTSNFGSKDQDSSNQDGSALIRRSESPITTNPDTAEALDQASLEYVMLLDANMIDEIEDLDSVVYTGLGHFTPRQWQGLLQITDDTPGLELVLSEGDMRLYRIVENEPQD